MEIGHWYSCELIGDGFTWASDLRSYSPIRVNSLTPLKKGNGTFELQFFHLNYPQGVQKKGCSSVITVGLLNPGWKLQADDGIRRKNYAGFDRVSGKVSYRPKAHGIC